MVLPPTSFVTVLGAASLLSACIALTISAFVMLCHLLVFFLLLCYLFLLVSVLLPLSLNEGAVSIFIDCELSFKC